VVGLNDPVLMNGSLLSNILTTSTIALSGTGSLLTLTLTANTDGGTEPFAFQNIVVSGESDDTGTVPVPTTVALLGLGLVGLGWSRRKKALTS